MNVVFHHIGQWVLPGVIPLREIEAIAQEWADDDKYLSVHVRRTSGDYWALGIEYRNPNGFSEKVFKTYLDRTKRVLVARFGTQNVGYDLANIYHRVGVVDQRPH